MNNPNNISFPMRIIHFSNGKASNFKERNNYIYPITKPIVPKKKKNQRKEPKPQNNHEYFLDEESKAIISDIDKCFDQISEILKSDDFKNEFESEIKNSEDFRKALDNLQES